MATKYVYMQVSIAIDLPEDTPPEPENWRDYDNWYDKWIKPALDPLYKIPGIDIEVHEEDYEL